MLVASMTLNEIRKEYQKDYPIVNRKGDYLLQKLKHETKPHGKDLVIRFYDYYSKYKNNWIIRAELSKKTRFLTNMVYYYNDIGLVGISSIHDDNVLIYHTSHFFKRFNERLHLNLVTPKEIMHAFLDEVDEYNGTKLETIKPGLFCLFSATPRGYCLGTYDENIKFMKMNTFITREMLHGDQIPLAERLSSTLEKYKDNASNLK